ncbi:VRR-NUC domain-containing protein [Kushneria sinocarnis]|uniref:VRR-NUC domain-containing protein n=1 Tax=Kushneria sinocarnis TaxID=595502 RepID=A0A420WVN3_9GAMM|nr:VRR-NUC domain-containing protein [Kushneria sinocarnis]RKR02609.1 VRR-NUC domain-containing protein [Kushneria sinocarnis]
MSTAFRKPARRKPVDHEGSEQKALISWLRGEYLRKSQVGQAWPATYHVPNGGHRHKATAGGLKAQGVKAGVSDLVVAVPRGGWHGLYIEFKATPPRHAGLQDSQHEWLAGVESHGYCAVLARGLEEARAVLREYMALPPTEVTMPPEQLAAGTDWRR